MLEVVRPFFKAAWQTFVTKTVKEKGMDLSVDYLDGLKDGYWAGVKDATRIGMSISTILPVTQITSPEDRPN